MLYHDKQHYNIHNATSTTDTKNIIPVDTNNNITTAEMHNSVTTKGKTALQQTQTAINTTSHSQIATLCCKSATVKESGLQYM